MKSDCESLSGASRVRVIGLVLQEAIFTLPRDWDRGGNRTGGFAAGEGAASLLYGLKPQDPVTLGGAAALLAMVALVASCGPAWRASRLEPMEAGCPG